MFIFWRKLPGHACPERAVFGLGPFLRIKDFGPTPTIQKTRMSESGGGALNPRLELVSGSTKKQLPGHLLKD